ncbi:hypothetical protein EDEG_01864 [Edhazardia aedis USNM 41457]|uniref:Uncharacterized protein n=1 Tax=Edhazardia aedis (strain USNM 41457) TaxID=1003232 RepID=J9DMQ7_EDHAE|nr:hypothetical protein EDEG_01864 [Edhazardia aedis USNM 41457]|eukprot:EJW03865.1 hypothetical protein EDEG_01864 [Edhazardia aedis USNM 41457]
MKAFQTSALIKSTEKNYWLLSQTLLSNLLNIISIGFQICKMIKKSYKGIKIIVILILYTTQKDISPDKVNKKVVIMSETSKKHVSYNKKTSSFGLEEKKNDENIIPYLFIKKDDVDKGFLLMFKDKNTEEEVYICFSASKMKLYPCKNTIPKGRLWRVKKKGDGYMIKSGKKTGVLLWQTKYCLIDTGVLNIAKCDQKDKKQYWNVDRYVESESTDSKDKDNKDEKKEEDKNRESDINESDDTSSFENKKLNLSKIETEKIDEFEKEDLLKLTNNTSSLEKLEEQIDNNIESSEEELSAKTIDNKKEYFQVQILKSGILRTFDEAQKLNIMRGISDVFDKIKSYQHSYKKTQQQNSSFNHSSSKFEEKIKKNDNKSLSKSKQKSSSSKKDSMFYSAGGSFGIIENQSKKSALSDYMASADYNTRYLNCPIPSNFNPIKAAATNLLANIDSYISKRYSNEISTDLCKPNPVNIYKTIDKLQNKTNDKRLRKGLNALKDVLKEYQESDDSSF